MQHVGYALCRALVGENFIMLIIVLCIEDMATFTALAKNFLPKFSAIQRYLGLAKFISSENFHVHVYCISLIFL